MLRGPRDPQCSRRSSLAGVRLRDRLSYANVVASVALFVALGALPWPR